MKKLTWMEIGIAMPMVLAFSSFGGVGTVAVATVIMLITMAILKWGGHIAVKRQEVEPVRMKVR